MFLSLLLSLAVTPQVDPNTWSAADHLPADTLFAVELDLHHWDTHRADTQAGQALAAVNFLRGPLGALESQWNGGKIESLSGQLTLRQMLKANRVTLALTPDSLAQGAALLVAHPRQLDLGAATAGAYFMNQGGLAWTVDGQTVVALLRLPQGDLRQRLEQDRKWLESFLARTQADDFRSLADHGPWQRLRRHTVLPETFAAIWLMPSAWEIGLKELLGWLQRAKPGTITEEVSDLIGRMIRRGYSLDRLYGVGFCAAVEGDRIHERWFMHGDGPTPGTGYGSLLFKPSQGDLYSLVGAAAADQNAMVYSMQLAALKPWMESLAAEAADSIGVDVRDTPEYRSVIDTMDKIGRAVGGHLRMVGRSSYDPSLSQGMIEIPLRDEALWSEAIAELPPELVAGFQLGLAQSGMGAGRIEDGCLRLGTAPPSKAPRWGETEEFASARKWIETNRGDGVLAGILLTDRVSNRQPISELRENGALLLDDLGFNPGFDLMQLQDDDYLDQVIGVGWTGYFQRNDGMQMDTLSPLGSLPALVVGALHLPAWADLAGEQEFDEEEF